MEGNLFAEIVQVDFDGKKVKSIPINHLTDGSSLVYEAVGLGRYGDHWYISSRGYSDDDRSYSDDNKMTDSTQYVYQISSLGNFISKTIIPEEMSTNWSWDEVFPFYVLGGDIVLGSPADRVSSILHKLHKGLLVIPIDGTESPTLRKVTAQVPVPEGFVDPAGISRCEEFGRNLYHLYFMEYSDIILESIEVDGVEILRIEKYHDETGTPLYRFDPALAAEEQYDTYKILIDRSSVYLDENNISGDGVLWEHATSEDEAQSPHNGEWELNPIIYQANRFYIPTPEDAKSVVVRYLVRDAFNIYFKSVEEVSNSIPPVTIGVNVEAYLSLADTYDLLDVTWEDGEDIYYHMGENLTNIGEILSLNPIVCIENSGFIYLSYQDTKIYSIDLVLFPEEIKMCSDSSVYKADEFVTFYAIARDIYGNPVPNVPLEVEVRARDSNNEEFEVTSNINYTEVTTIAGKISGIIKIPHTPKDIAAAFVIVRHKDTGIEKLARLRIT